VEGPLCHHPTELNVTTGTYNLTIFYPYVHYKLFSNTLNESYLHGEMIAPVKIIIQCGADANIQKLKSLKKYWNKKLIL
jgi:hypothetical protein